MNGSYKTYSIEVSFGGSYDVIVCGGGTAGCAAAIAAAREGARTLLIERSFTLGGMLTEGNAGITKATVHYSDKEEYRDNVINKLGEHPEQLQVVGGIAKEYCHRMMENGDAIGSDGQMGSYVFTDRYGAQWTLMDMMAEAGVTILYDSKVCRAVKEGNKIVGVVVHNKSGFTEYTAACVIDTTGDGDVAVLAGANYALGTTEDDIEEGGGTEPGQLYKASSMYRVRGVDMDKLIKYLKENPDKFHVQPFGVMMLDDVVKSIEKGDMAVFHVNVRKPDGSISQVQVYNTPAPDEVILLASDQRIPVDGTDAMDVSKKQRDVWENIRENLQLIKNNVPGFENARMIYLPDIGIRETRRIIGDYYMRGEELLCGVDFEDSIGCGCHPIDVDNLRGDIKRHKYVNWKFHIPYRIMLPVGVENLLVAGRCVSVSRMVFGCIRPTVQCMILGEAAGTAAAMSVKDGVGCRYVDVKKLRATLINNGAIL